MILALRHNVGVKNQILANQNPALTSVSRDIHSSTVKLSLMTIAIHRRALIIPILHYPLIIDTCIEVLISFQGNYVQI